MMARHCGSYVSENEEMGVEKLKKPEVGQEALVY